MFLGWDVPYRQVRKRSGFVCGDRFPKCSAFTQQHIPRVGWGMGYRAHALGDGFCAPGDGGCALGAPLVWEQLNLDPALLLWAQHWEREYIAPIIGSDLKGRNKPVRIWFCSQIFFFSQDLFSEQNSCRFHFNPVNFSSYTSLCILWCWAMNLLLQLQKLPTYENPEHRGWTIPAF